MKVKAAPGTKCPQEGKPRQYITDTEPVEVPASAYYRRLVAEGSLILQSIVISAQGKIMDASNEGSKK